MDASEPFAQSGAVPAGFAGPDDKHLGETMGKGYGRGGDPFDDDEVPSAYSFSAPQAGPYSRAKRGRWATFKENHLTDVDWTFGVNSLLGRKSKFDGVPREISLNDPAGNKVKGFENNSVSTGKYGPITFLPKFLFCKPLSRLPVVSRADSVAEFSRSANLFFLFTACIQQVPGVSPTGRYTTIVPLAVVIIASAFKEIQEDFVSFRILYVGNKLTSRNVTHPINRSTTIKLRCSLIKALTKDHGAGYASEMSSVSMSMRLFQPTWSCSAVVSRKDYVMWKPPTWTERPI